MIPTHRFFDGNTQIEYEGRLYAMIYELANDPGKYRLHFEFISTDSVYEQSIGLSLYRFKGSVTANGEKVKLGKRLFSSITFAESCTPKEFDVCVEMKSGSINIFNSMEGWNVPAASQTPQLLPAMIVEKVNDSNYVFHCNDRVYDDDFDDLVFSLSVTRLE